ncbi:MAG: D-alanyl-D-alanine carboxypeptidase [Firmicutes bacterium]|nr:D-alanyl-D-alanine carboxypeptidase [Bacillota bacterium]
MKTKRIRRILGILLIAAVTMGVVPQPSFALTQMPRLEGSAAILLDMTSGEVLYENNADEQRFPASTTKMMTALLALENLDLESDITVDAEAANIGGSGIKLREGEIMNADVMLHAMLIPSSNDCAVAIAKTIAGSVDNFAVMMNAKARELGCKGTNFVNPCGLHEDDHYTTARDLSIIAMECMKNEHFREIVAMPEYTVPATNLSDARDLVSSNLLLWDETERHKIYVGNDLRYPKYDGTIGIKTGYTPQAGGCLVAACEKDGTRLLSVVMECTDMGRFADTIKLFNWGFENYKTYTVLHGGYSFGDVKVKHGEFNKVEAVLLTDVAYTLPADASVDIMSAQAVLQESIKAPVKKGDDVGVITLYEGDEPVGTYRAVAAKSIAEGGLLSYFGIEDSTAKVIGRIALVVIVLLVLALATYVMIMRRKMKIKKARKARKLAQKQQEEAIKRAQWEHYYEGSKYRSSDEEK